MRSLTQKIRRRFARKLVEEDGSPSVEFVILFPTVLIIVLSIFEAGWLMTRMMMLDRGVDIAVRDIRLGGIYDADTDSTLPITHENIKQRICDGAAIFADCMTTLKVQLVPFEVTGDYPWDVPNCRDRDAEDDELQPVDEFFQSGGGTSDQVMFMRACVVVDPILPGLGLGLALPKDSSNGYQMASFSAFKNEPE